MAVEAVGRHYCSDDARTVAVAAVRRHYCSDDTRTVAVEAVRRHYCSGDTRRVAVEAVGDRPGCILLLLENCWNTRACLPLIL